MLLLAEGRRTQLGEKLRRTEARCLEDRDSTATDPVPGHTVLLGYLRVVAWLLQLPRGKGRENRQFKSDQQLLTQWVRDGRDMKADNHQGAMHRTAEDRGEELHAGYNTKKAEGKCLAWWFRVLGPTAADPGVTPGSVLDSGFLLTCTLGGSCDSSGTWDPRHGGDLD